MKPAFCALAALLLGLSAAAVAASPEDDYVAARDAAIEKLRRFEATNPNADSSRLDRQALAGLDRRLQGVIGGLSAKPYPAKGKIAIDTLSDGNVGSGGLDALRFANRDGGAQVFVTTEGLLGRWLGKPAEWWTKTRKTPPAIEEALANEEFYTFAIGDDAAFSKTIGLPVEKPAGVSYAVALLGGWAQDVGPNPDQEIIVALRKDGKIYIATEKAEKYRPIPACETIWTSAQAKADETYKKYADGGAKDQKILDAYTAIQERADKDYRACYADRVSREAFFPALVREAQEIADRFGSK